MELTLLGTGAPTGLPRPDCPCAVCAACVKGRTNARAATAVLVDGIVLLDLTPGPAFAAARAGRSLHGVRQVLLSHPHEGPAMELPAGLPAPLRVSERQDLALISGHRIRAVALDSPGTGYHVTGPGGERLLYLPPRAAPAGLEEGRETGSYVGPAQGSAEASGAGHAPGSREQGSQEGPAHGSVHASRAPSRTENVPDGPYDMVLLDVLGRPEALARLRAAGAVGPATDVVAVHIDHDVSPGPELHRRLAAAGAHTEADGTTLVVGDYPDLPEVPRRTLVLGGARSGKSAEAEQRLAAFPGVVYVATGGSRDGDPEWAARVGAHKERRPASWRTEETCDLVPLLEASGPPLLIDCLALWLTDAMDSVGAWDDERWATVGSRMLRERVSALLAALRRTRRTVVAVSNEVGSGIVPGTASGRRFRDELGRLNAEFAAECEHVLLVTAGVAQPLRG
ncbi:bifunctional adenosylcobinamide kinase/adenosylcobinamide-phosphate guanylyltransferase [Streptomyces marispadix]|uniref:Adenosylcobinamide kinase n=1 Tax=Streptomyces marispadix TaxID=2922868 RepID=A0ABS9SUY3_9ACTN|nr:bifunctional adenosylcobinamide kinase/adenosylcobinamide-phosphate guanylyltransferase [Streptomyces marispadix]MCH6159861.1 bifunctional adenosylcobinamide kinase/adenosylcobinamide-phosphate guanylyltransferase [Streptomyces marispadix]